MASKNVETFMAAHRAFNKRDFEAVLNLMTENVKYEDRARGVSFEGRTGFKQFMQGWVTAFSNAEVYEPKYTDAGNVVIAQFIGRGTNDGPLGPLPKSGRTMKVPFCEIMTFNDKGLIVSGVAYYDQLSIMIQLGHAQPAETAKAR